jgi:hypothetical protein
MSQELASVILAALTKLDAKNDNHWTADGLPRLDTVKMLASNATLTRDIVTAAAPDFNRASYTLWLEQKDGGAQGPAQPDQATQAAPAAQPPEQPNPAAAEPAPASTPETGGSDNAQEAQPPQVGGGAPSGEDEIPALEAQLEKACEYTAYLRRGEVELKAEMTKALDAEDKIRHKLDRARPKDDNAQAIQKYLQSQKDRAMARAGRAPIDQAMQRPMGYGKARPKI